MTRGFNTRYYHLIRPRWRKVLADLWGNKVRSILVVLSIAIGVYAVGLVATMYMVITADMRAGYTATNPANILISSSPFSPDFVHTFRNRFGVRDAQGAYVFRARAKTGNGEWISVEFKAVQDYRRLSVDKVLPLQGSWPPQRRQVVFDQYKFSDLHRNVGDYIQVELPSGTIRELEIVGLLQDQSIGAGGNGGFFVNPPLGYISFNTLEWLEQPRRFNRLYATALYGQEDEEHLRSVMNQVSDVFEDHDIRIYSSVNRRTSDHPNSIYVDAIAGVLFLLGFLVVFLSAFLITNTLSALLNQQTQQIGILKSIGGRSSQIIGIYTTLIFLYSLMALGLALPLSSQISFVLLEFLSRQINFTLQGYRVIPLANILQIVIALVVPQLAGLAPIMRGASVPVMEALSGLSPNTANSRPSLLERIGNGLRHLPRPLLLSLRNTFRKRTRLALTLTTLILGGAVFIATINVRASLTDYIQRLSRYFAADVNLTFSEPYLIKRVEKEIMVVPGVRHVEGWASAVGKLVLPDGSEGETVNILAPPVNSQLVEPIVIAGRWIQPGDTNAITVNERFLSQYPDMKIGDTLKMKINGEEESFRIVGFFQYAGKSGGFLAYTSYDQLADLIDIRSKSSVYRVAADLDNHNVETQKGFGAALENHLERKGFSILDVSAGQFMLKSAANGLNVLTAFLLIMAALTALVGSIGLMGTLSMNVLERTREIGVMRAIGASNQAIMMQVIVEGLIIGGISWLAGSVVALPISKLMADIVSYSLFSAPASFTYSWYSCLLWLIVVLILSLVSSVVPARSAARLTIREVLAYE